MIRLLFFRGHGIIPILVRLLTWHWWHGQHWSRVPAHVAITIPVWNALAEYEAIITGVQVTLLAESDLPTLNGLIADVPVDVPLIGAAQHWLDAQVGRPYGFLTSAATGLGIVSPPWLDRWWARGWEHLAGGKSGRTAPLNCSLLCQLALGAGGLDIPGRSDGLPVSPNDLLRILQT